MSREEKIRKMLDQEPDDTFLNFSLAMELAKAENWDAAMAQFDRVIEIDSGYVAAFFHKGQTLAKKGDIERAKETLTAGIARAGEVGDFHAKREMEEFIEMI